jgi:hypothetical protein
VIYSVVPPELVDELYDRLVERYRDEPQVEVIVDRRSGPDRRRSGGSAPAGEQRHTRDRRRRGIAGTFPGIDVPE